MMHAESKYHKNANVRNQNVHLCEPDNHENLQVPE